MYKILIVDDIEQCRNINEKIIKNIFGNECKIIYAETAIDGFNTVVEHKNNPFDIILTDLQMEDDFEPEYAGEWFIKSIKGLIEYQKTFVVAISASSDIKSVAERTGINFIPKQQLYYNPLSLKYLLEENGF